MRLSSFICFVLMWKPIIFDVECIVCNKSLQKIKHNPRDNEDMGKVTNNNSNRRLRTPNWSFDEKQYLLELIKARKEVVITKSNNGPNYSEEKDVAWNEILRELNLKFGNKFSGSSIKKVKTQWQNMKRIAREEIAANGPVIYKLSRQSVEVCNILDMIKDGVLKIEGPNLNESSMTTDVVIKAERIDEDVNQPSCSGVNNIVTMIVDDQPIREKEKGNTYQFESSASSASEQVSEVNEFEATEDMNDREGDFSKRNASIMTDATYCKETHVGINPFHNEMQEYFKFVSAEKYMKMESLKEERQVIRAMRETAELNKIIAEQKLKHVLWVKKQEMAMYSGEPGSGAGKGGGGGGAIRDAGGSFGKMEAAREDEYFYKKQKEQLQNLKGHLDKEINFHQEQIKRHEDAIRRHKDQVADMDKK